MTSKKTVFGIYRSVPAVEEAVDQLMENGTAGASIFVLHPKNEDTVEFANRKHTHCVTGTGDGPYADVPLDGSIGLLDPLGPNHGLLHWLWDPLGPRKGALHGALSQMGVPEEWCDKRVVHGKLLISVKCSSWEKFFRTTGVLKFTESEDISWSVSLDQYRASRSRTGYPSLDGSVVEQRSS
jgi:hypothetical protein